MKLNKKLTVWVVAAALSHTAGLQAAHAAMIATSAVEAQAETEAAGAQRAHVLATLNRADVSQALMDRGVDMEAARARVAAMSDAEAAELSKQIDEAPAGGTDVLGVLVFLFVLLLVTDILGLTKVFPFTRSVRR